MTSKISQANLRRASLAGLSLLALATAARAQNKSENSDVEQVVVTAARTILPASALPLTVDVIDRETLSRQVAVSGSVVDATIERGAGTLAMTLPSIRNLALRSLQNPIPAGC